MNAKRDLKKMLQLENVKDASIPKECVPLNVHPIVLGISNNILARIKTIIKSLIVMLFS